MNAEAWFTLIVKLTIGSAWLLIKGVYVAARLIAQGWRYGVFQLIVDSVELCMAPATLVTDPFRPCRALIH